MVAWPRATEAASNRVTSHVPPAGCSVPSPGGKFPHILGLEFPHHCFALASGRFDKNENLKHLNQDGLVCLKRRFAL
jgi:hypothetical protein